MNLGYLFSLFSPNDAQDARYLDNLCMLFQSSLRVRGSHYQNVALRYNILNANSMRIVAYNIGTASINEQYHG